MILAQTPTATPTTPVLDEDSVFAGGTGPCPNQTPSCEAILEWTGNESLARLGGEILPALLTVIIVLVATVIVARIVRRLAHRAVLRTAAESMDALHSLRLRGVRLRRRRPEQAAAELTEVERIARQRQEQRARTVGAVFASVGAFVVWAVGALVALSQLGINIGPFLASAGIVGVALGFGAQSLVKDFLTGMFMLLEDQYGVGDIIDAGHATGAVEAISLRVTRLRDVEGTVWHIPNGEIARIGNFSQLWSRSLIDIGVAYQTDTDRAGEIILGVANEMAADPGWQADILEDPELWGVQDFGPNEVIIRLVMKVSPARQWAINREFRRRVKKALDAAGIEIPFPQRTVWLRNDDGDALDGT